jgi:molecular chaperone GrpE
MKLPFVSRDALQQAEQQLGSLNQEYQNYRRRNADLKDTAYRQGQEDAVRTLLTVYDNLVRALEQPCADAAFLQGIEMTRSAMAQSLSSLGITEIPALGEVFDPNIHEALSHTDAPDQGENIITQVVRTGFRRGDTVLRHALVIVAN